MIFEAIWAISRIIIIIIMRFHKLLKYLSLNVFMGVFIVGEDIVSHIIIMIILIIVVLFKFDHFCFELGNNEIT